MDTQVRIRLRFSRAYFVLLLVLVLILALTLTLLPLETGWRWFGYLGLLASLAWLLWRDVSMRSGRSCTSLVYGKDRNISLAQRNGEQISGVVCADTLVSSWLILLIMTLENHGRRSLLLLPDVMAAEDYRRLRILLRNSDRPQS